MTEQEQDEIHGRLMREYREADEKVICIEAKLDEIGEFLADMSKLTKRDPMARLYNMEGENNTLRFGSQAVPHSDQDIHKWLEKRKEWKRKRGGLESQLKKLGIDVSK